MSNSEVIFEFPRKIFYAASYGFMPTFPGKACILFPERVHAFSGKSFAMHPFGLTLHPVCEKAVKKLCCKTYKIKYQNV